ncbi:uncharacterized protein IAS62_005270 [Cryptococcus decagattii]|uniref:Uncharacterized protein n=1 Tax=Cryptococcus decagattii TaxID=1859122 RepID=A0ABZ2B2R7_9TREE
MQASSQCSPNNIYSLEYDNKHRDEFQKMMSRPKGQPCRETYAGLSRTAGCEMKRWMSRAHEQYLSTAITPK